MGDEVVALEGLHALKHALRFGAEIAWARSSNAAAVLDLAGQVCPDLVDVLEALLVEVTVDELASLAQRPLPSPVVAQAVRPAWQLGDLEDRRQRPVVLLQRPTHLGNLGAVVRVAAAADAAGVLSTGPADPWHPAAVRGAAGLQFALPVLGRLDGLPPLYRPLVALDPDGRDHLADVPTNSVLAFGSERDGLDDELLGQADLRVGLPMRPGVSSLNLATSVAATMYALAARADD